MYREEVRDIIDAEPWLTVCPSGQGQGVFWDQDWEIWHIHHFIIDEQKKNKLASDPRFKDGVNISFKEGTKWVLARWFVFEAGSKIYWYFFVCVYIFIGYMTVL